MTALVAAPAARHNILDRLISYISPAAAARRARSRLAMSMLSAYEGARHDKRSLSAWTTFGNDPDTDILPDLATLRARSRDLVRNNPLAAGAVKTKVTNVVGTGLRLQSHIDRQALGLDEAAADLWESAAEREWRLFWRSKECDVARTCTGHELTRQVYQQAKENGDVLVLLPRLPRPGVVYDLRLQVVEADRLCNPNNKIDADGLSGGVEYDPYGAPVAYHIAKYHPNTIGAIMAGRQAWTRVPAYGGKTGLRNVLHLFSQTRPGQRRGVPDLAAVIEPLKQLGRYTEAEIMAAVISGMFTVFIESESGDMPFSYSNSGTELGVSSSDKDYKLGNGMIVELGKGEKVHDSNPGRPNQSFDPFVVAILRQIGVGLEIPFEILIKHFTASYSAARAAINEFWKYVQSERQWLLESFLLPVYEVWMWEAVAAGRIAAPGFFADPIRRQAYLGCDFVGPSKGQINEQAEVGAAVERVAAGLSTLAIETANLTGGDWERNHEQRVKEHRMRREAGLVGDAGQPGQSPEEAQDE
jgi:lambda family phage portal protein